VGAAVLHDLFDFSLELGPTALAFALLTAVAVAPPARSWSAAERQARRWPRLRAAQALVAILAIAAVGGVGLTFGRDTAPDAHRELAAVVHKRYPAATLREVALPLIDRHPADYFLYLLVADGFTSAEGGDAATALAFANRALQLRPIDGHAHQVAGRALLALGRRSQAMLEYRLAFESNGNEVLSESVHAARGLDELSRIVPAQPAHVVDVFHHLWTQQRRDEATALIGWARTELGTAPGAAQLWAASAHSALARGELPDAIAWAEQAATLDPQGVSALVIKARALHRVGREREAIDVLHNALVRHPGDFEAATTLAGYLHGSGLRSQARETLDRLGPFLRGDRQRAEVHSLQARLYLSEGRLARALDNFGAASRLRPEDPALRYELARLYERLRRPADALREVREATRIEGRTSEENTAWLIRLEQAESELDRLQQERLLLGAGGPPEL
jgi:tetratricopeptide (TPR) repeat protein